MQTNRLWTWRAFEVVRIQRRQNLINYCSADLFDTSVCPHLAPGTKVSKLPRTFSSRLRWRKVLINSHLPTVAWCAGSSFRWLFCHLWYRMSTKAAALGFNPKATQLQTISQYSRVLTYFDLPLRPFHSATIKVCLFVPTFYKIIITVRRAANERI